MDERSADTASAAAPTRVGRGADRPARELSPASDAALLILPTLNEEVGLAATLADVRAGGRLRSGRFPTILVVDGHSTDATVAVAHAHGTELIVQQGRGKGAAVREGLAWGAAHGFSLLAVIDADGTYPARRLPGLYHLLEHGADVVVGVRRRPPGGPATARDAVHRTGNGLLNLCAAYFGRGPILDVCSGFWGLRAATLPGLALQSTGFEIESELIVKSFRQARRVVQIPVEYRPRIGQAKLHAARDGARILLSILRFGLSPAARGPEGAAPDGAAQSRFDELCTVIETMDPDEVRVVGAPDRRHEAIALADSLNDVWAGTQLVIADGPPEPAVTVDVALPGPTGPVAYDNLVVRDPKLRQIVRIGAGASVERGPEPPAIPVLGAFLPGRLRALGTLSVLGAALDPSGRRRERTLVGANLPSTPVSVLAAVPGRAAPPRPPDRPDGLPVPPGWSLFGR